MKVALSAYSVSVGMYLSVGGLGGMCAHTSHRTSLLFYLRAAST